jgi:hypothetical protein
MTEMFTRLVRIFTVAVLEMQQIITVSNLNSIQFCPFEAARLKIHVNFHEKFGNVFKSKIV